MSTTYTGILNRFFLPPELVTEHTLGQIQQFISPTRKKLQGLLAVVSWTSLAKLNFVLLWAKLHLLPKTLDNVNKNVS